MLQVENRETRRNSRKGLGDSFSEAYAPEMFLAGSAGMRKTIRHCAKRLKTESVRDDLGGAGGVHSN